MSFVTTSRHADSGTAVGSPRHDVTVGPVILVLYSLARGICKQDRGSLNVADVRNDDTARLDSVATGISQATDPSRHSPQPSYEIPYATFFPALPFVASLSFPNRLSCPLPLPAFPAVLSSLFTFFPT